MCPARRNTLPAVVTLTACDFNLGASTMAAANDTQNSITGQTPQEGVPGGRQAQTPAIGTTDSGTESKNGTPLATPRPAEGTLSFDKLDKAAEWAAYAAAGRCARLIADQVLAAAGVLPAPHPHPVAIPSQASSYEPPPPDARRPVILVVGFPGAMHCAGGDKPAQRFREQLARFDTALHTVSARLNALLAEAEVKEAQAGREAAAGQEQSAVTPAHALEAPLLDYGPVLKMVGSLIGGAVGGLPGFLAGTALPNMVSGIGAVVGLTASALAYLRADYEVHGATASVPALAVRTAVCGALADGGRVYVKMLNVEDVEDSIVVASLDSTAWTALETRLKVAALGEVLRLRQAELEAHQAERRALFARRWNVKVVDLLAPYPPASEPSNPPKPSADPHAGGHQDGANGEQPGAAGESKVAVASLPADRSGRLYAYGHTELAVGNTGDPDTPPPSGDSDESNAAADSTLLQSSIDAIERRLEEFSAQNLRWSAAVKEAETLLAAFDSWAAKVTASVDGQPPPLLRAALREAAAAVNADYLLYVSLDTVGAEATGRSRSLLTLLSGDGALTLSGHAAASFLLTDGHDCVIAAGDMVGASTSIRHTVGDGRFREWGYAEFKRTAPAT